MEQTWEMAAQTANIQAFYALLQRYPNFLDDMDAKSIINTPAHIAASHGHTDFALEVLTLKPSLGKKLNLDGLTPLHLALQNGHINTAERLLRHDVELIRVKGKGGNTPLHCAVELGYVDRLKSFVRRCPKSIEDWNVQEETVFHIAARMGNVGEVKVLLDILDSYGNEYINILNSFNARGYTALHAAAEANNLEIVRLLKKKANIAIKTNWEQGAKVIDLATEQRVKDSLRCQDLASILTPSAVKEILIRFLSGSGEEISSLEQVNALLVVCALIVTATFQALLSPRGGISSGDQNSDQSQIGKSQMKDPFFYVFLYVNSIAFFGSLTLIWILVEKAHRSRLLKVSLVFLSVNYGLSAATISPNIASVPYQAFSIGFFAIAFVVSVTLYEIFSSWIKTGIKTVGIIKPSLFRILKL